MKILKLSPTMQYFSYVGNRDNMHGKLPFLVHCMLLQLLQSAGLKGKTRAAQASLLTGFAMLMIVPRLEQKTTISIARA